ncbi:NAD(P)/FAD-dependent oxidoreductase [Leucobacter manosquensis]|uniref:FAD-binding oxidoreductase n=1 Tax=Leucobacter manosquensis TaxID=2810611 RepID=A0ABS5M361_9MICO|nr:FAD-binding oxidoreductase [Leucobacter manosquensis]MBS3181634.1 FAD-binding oxidoreductase [Leucobacter manosquensis]
MIRHHVVVVGGGLIGLSTAHALLREGHKVTIVEKRALGSGAATGNAGELTPQQVAPLASANTARDVFRGVLSRNSYLSIDPLQLPRLARFGLGFLRAARTANASRGAAALAQFSGGIRAALQRMADDGVDISGGGDGFLMTSSDETELDAAHAAYRSRAERGWGAGPGPVLRGDELRAAEPALQPTVVGGFMLPGEFSLDPVTFVASLVERVRAGGADIREGLAAMRIGTGPSASIVCADENGAEVTVRGDRLVIAAGAWTTSILRRSRIRSAPVVSGKGYSFTVPVDRMPSSLVHAMDLHCVAIPMHGRLRIVGMMEFDGHPERANPHRFEVLTRAASRLIADADWSARTDDWVGARPMTADGLPLLGRVPRRPDVIVAAGHNMHGLSLGPITGEIVAALVADREPFVEGRRLDLAPFAVRR